MKRRQTECVKRHAFIKQSNLQEQKIEEIKKHQLDSCQKNHILKSCKLKTKPTVVGKTLKTDETIVG